jgi:plastocyanin
MEMAQTYQVSIQNMQFDPDNVGAATGDTVRWTNTMGMQHTVTADDGSFDSGPIAQGETFSQVFNAAGSVGYHCEIHPQMTGTIIVT